MLIEEFKDKLKDAFPEYEDYYTIISLENNNIVIAKDRHGLHKTRVYKLIKKIKPSIKTAINKTEYYINKAVEKRGLIYDYSKVKYINNYTKVEIVCNKHGSFYQTPKNHLQNEQNCPLCVILKGKYHPVKNTIDDFKEKAYNKHKGEYTYIKFDEEDESYVHINCKKHGDFKQKKSVHLTGSGCKQCAKDKMPIKYTHDYLIETLKLNNSHYLKGDFKVVSECRKRHSRVLVEDKYGICNVSVSNLVGGCNTSIVTAVDKLQYFINQANEKHKGLYDYSHIKSYKNNNDYLNITCKIHGIFKQKAMSHLNGSGCPLCKLSPFNYNEWGENGKKSHNFESFKLYIVKVYRDNEVFYKVGKTFTSLKSRFYSIPYSFEPIYIYESDHYKVCVLENLIHKLLTFYRYKPKKVFGGYTECFYKLPENLNAEIQKIIENEL